MLLQKPSRNRWRLEEGGSMGFEAIYKLSVVLSMVDRLTSPIRGVGSEIQGTMGKINGMSQSFGNMITGGAAMAAAGTQIAEGVLQPVAATFETRRALGELSSLGVKDLQTIEDAAKEFSSTWAGTTKPEFISAAYDIKSGIASLTDAGVAGYTEVAGITATATKSTIGEMTDLFATGYGIYKDFYSDLSDMQFAEMFSAGISNSVQIFKTTGSGMSEAIKTMGASATTAQVPLEEQLAVLGMLQSTMSGSEAGTKYRAFLKSAAKGGEELGLKFTDANNQLLSMPEILGILKSRFGDTIDAAEKMDLQKAFGDEEAVALIDLMYNKTGAMQDNILKLYDSMGQGTAATQQMADAINNTEPAKFEQLKQKVHITAESIGNTLLPTVNDLMGRIDGVLTKADAWIANNQDLVRVIMQVALVLGAFLAVGGTTITIVGTVGRIFTGTAGMVLKFGGVLKAIPGGLETIYLKALYGDGVRGAFSKIHTAGSVAAGGIKTFAGGIATMGKNALSAATTALKPLITSVWGFTSALLANPITWIVIAIVALIAVFVLLYNKCEWFRNGVNAIWGGIKEGASAVASFFSNMFSGVKNAAGSILEAARSTVSEKLGNIKAAYEANGGGIKGIAAGAMEAVKGYYTAGFTFLDNLTGGKLSSMAGKVGEGMQKIKDKISGAMSWFRESGKKVLDTFAEGIKSAVSAPVNAVKGGLQKIREMLPFSDAKTGPLSTLTLSGRRVLETFGTGIKQTENVPAETVEQSFDRMDFSTARPEYRKEGKESSETGNVSG
ncbi:MAG: phage tail tape measure protein [Eisenbergiella massiliensis]